MEQLIGKPGGGVENAQGQPIRVDVQDLPSLTCSSCGSAMWQQAFVVKRISPIQSPTGKEELVTVPVLVCVTCRTPLLTFELQNAPAPQRVAPPPPTDAPVLKTEPIATETGDPPPKAAVSEAQPQSFAPAPQQPEKAEDQQPTPELLNMTD